MEENRGQFREEDGSKKSFGPMVGIVIIVILLIAGAFYVWGGKMWNKAPDDDIESIESELSGTDTDVDLSGLDDIE